MKYFDRYEYQYSETVDFIFEQCDKRSLTSEISNKMPGLNEGNDN